MAGANKASESKREYYMRKETSTYLRLSQEELQKAIDRGKAKFEKSGYETIEEYAASLRK